MSISVLYQSRIAVTKTFTGPYVSAVDPAILIDQLSTSETSTASSTIPVTKDSAYQLTLSSGTGTIDLTALIGVEGTASVDGTGLKVQYMKFRNLSTNANSITVAKGASNGYGLNAAGTTWSIPISPGQEILFKGNDSSPDVGSGAKTIDVTGTGSQVLEVAVVLG